MMVDASESAGKGSGGSVGGIASYDGGTGSEAAEVEEPIDGESSGLGEPTVAEEAAGADAASEARRGAFVGAGSRTFGFTKSDDDEIGG